MAPQQRRKMKTKKVNKTVKFKLVKCKDGTHRRFTEEGIEVIDAADNLRIHVLPIDEKRGVPGDPSNCALMKANARMVGPKVPTGYIGRGIAYTGTIGEDGVPFLERRRVSPVTARRIRAFDKTGKFHPAGYLLEAITESHKLDYRREHPWRKAIKKPGSRRVFVKKPAVKLSVVRNLTGAFFTKFVSSRKVVAK